MKKTIITNSEAETEKAAADFAKNLSPCVLAFSGGMGMGKTAFTRGLASGLGYTGEVTSPTFAIVHEYIGGRLNLYHFDMYRIDSYDDLYSCGFFDYLECGVLAVEWSENVDRFMPEDAIKINISHGENDNQRVIEIEYPDNCLQ